MPEAPANANWFTYFPEDYRWSAAVCGMLSGARWGASEIGEVDQVGRRLAMKLGDDEHWFNEWVRMGDFVAGLGRGGSGRGASSPPAPTTSGRRATTRWGSASAPRRTGRPWT